MVPREGQSMFGPAALESPSAYASKWSGQKFATSVTSCALQDHMENDEAGAAIVIVRW